MSTNCPNVHCFSFMDLRVYLTPFTSNNSGGTLSHFNPPIIFITWIYAGFTSLGCSSIISASGSSQNIDNTSAMYSAARWSFAFEWSRCANWYNCHSSQSFTFAGTSIFISQSVYFVGYRCLVFIIPYTFCVNAYRVVNVLYPAPLMWNRGNINPEVNSVQTEK